MVRVLEEGNKKERKMREMKSREKKNREEKYEVGWVGIKEKITGPRGTGRPLQKELLAS